MQPLCHRPWQSAFGAKIVAGNGPWSIISVNSSGPGLHTVDADTMMSKPAANTNLNSTPLVYYPIDHQQLGLWDSNLPGQTVNGIAVPDITVTDPYGRSGLPVGNGGGPTWHIPYESGIAEEVRGVVLADGTRTALFFGKRGLGPFCYGPATDDPTLVGKPATSIGDTQDNWCYDPDGGGGKGGHAYPYTAFVWAYDANDLATVKAGKLAPWMVYPYAAWPMKFDGFGGVSWDPITRLLYVSEPGADGDGPSNPVIHVFKIGAGS